MTEEELLVAYGTNADGVPYRIHEELRAMRNVVEVNAAEVRAIRELLEVLVSALGVEVVAEWSREAGT
jgi:hypothetical protein